MSTETSSPGKVPFALRIYLRVHHRSLYIEILLTNQEPTKRPASRALSRYMNISWWK